MGKTISPVAIRGSANKVANEQQVTNSKRVPEENGLSHKNGIIKHKHQKKESDKVDKKRIVKDKNQYNKVDKNRIVKDKNQYDKIDKNRIVKDRNQSDKVEDQIFQYGNYNRYYGYRNLQGEDPRLQRMKKKWFENFDILDVGCNVGHVTLEIAKKFSPRKIIGLDIDGSLIKAARRNVRHYISKKEMSNAKFPVSMALTFGPVALNSESTNSFPTNVLFVEGNYVLETDELLEIQQPEFDMILCLSLTKWIHLNWGDSGLKRAFKRMYAQLRPGGRMLLEAQTWESYRRKRKLTETIYENYKSIEFLPEQFNEYLLSEVGFSRCKEIDAPDHPSKGFCRPMYLFTKKAT